MPVDLSIKNVPDHIVEGLCRRAAKHDRSLQWELIAILEESVRELVLLTHDANYLWLARHLNGVLITSDKKMRRAMAK